MTATRVRAAVESRTARDVAIEDAVAAHQRGDAASAEVLAAALPTIRAAPGGPHDGYFDFARVLDDVRDPALPTWLRGVVADAHEGTYFSLKADADRGALSGIQGGQDAASVEAVLGQWPDAVAAVRAELGDDKWRGPDLDKKWDCEDALAVVRSLDEPQERWFHEHVQDAVRRERQLSLDGWGYLLEPLVANGRFTVADADAVLLVWRPPLVGKADDYQRTQHPLLSLALGLLHLGHPQAATVTAAIDKLRPKWALPLKYVLAGYADTDRCEELWQATVTTHLDGQHGAMAGYVLMNARLRGIPPLHAAIEAYQQTRELTQPPRSVVSGAAWWLALEFASGHPRLLNRNARPTTTTSKRPRRSSLTPHCRKRSGRCGLTRPTTS